jgi:hypothetical protein
MTHKPDDFLSRAIELPDDLIGFQAEAMERGWGDGLPLIPPTPARVAWMLAGTDRPASEVLLSVPPLFNDCTIEKLAITAVMAGCLPGYMPVLIAAIEAVAEPRFSLLTMQATTHPCGPMVLVNGPIAAHLGLHGGTGALGPGWRANATIGRAVRLVLQNIGGAYPGKGDMSSQGSPAKYSFCFAENEAASPWPAYHVSCGFQAEESVVTVHSAEAPNEINDHVATDARTLFTTFCETIASMGKNNAYSRMAHYFVGVSPEHARIFARDGFSREDVQRYLYERARIPYGLWRSAGMYRANEAKGVSPLAHWLSAADDRLGVPMSESPREIHIVVVGGEGRHSAWMPSNSSSQPVSRLVTRANGSAWTAP